MPCNQRSHVQLLSAKKIIENAGFDLQSILKHEAWNWSMSAQVHGNMYSLVLAFLKQCFFLCIHKSVVCKVLYFRKFPLYCMAWIFLLLQASSDGASYLLLLSSYDILLSRLFVAYICNLLEQWMELNGLLVSSISVVHCWFWSRVANI